MIDKILVGPAIICAAAIRAFGAAANLASCLICRRRGGTKLICRWCRTFHGFFERQRKDECEKEEVVNLFHEHYFKIF